jgi:ABC-type amino acid transport substrate-binding protein
MNMEESAMKKTVSLFLALLMILTLSSAMAEGTLRVGMECNYAPFNWTQAEANEFTVPIEGGIGYADGYDVQIAKKIAEGLGKELVIVKTEWDGLPMGVDSGMLDAIIAGMSPTAERKTKLDFSEPYYSSELVVVVKKDSKFAGAKSLADLTGANITAQLNTFHYTVIDQIPGVVKATAMESFPAMIVAVRSGFVDGYIAERPGAEADVMANPDLTYIAFPQGSGFTTSPEDVAIAVGLKMGSPLTADINKILAGLDDATRLQMMLDATARQPLTQQ